MRFLDWTARPLVLAINVVALVVFRAGMQATLADLRRVSDESILDYEIGYSRARVLEILGHYGQEGVAIYQRFMTFDLVFPFLYGVFFASLLHLMLKATHFRLLALAPLVMASFDYVENAFFYAFLKSFPHISGIAVVCANLISAGKFGFGAISAVAAIVAAIVLIRSRFKHT